MNPKQFLTLLLALLLTGCATVYRHDGVQISAPYTDRPAGSPKPIMTGKIRNIGQHTFWAEYNRNGLHEVPPGQTFEITSTTKEILELHLRAYIPVGNDVDRRTVEVRRTAYVSWDKVLEIDDLFWLGLELQNGYLVNDMIVPIIINDGLGRSYHIEPLTFVPATISPGMQVWTWYVLWPGYTRENAPSYSAPHFVDNVHNDVPFLDGVTDWVFRVQPD